MRGTCGREIISVRGTCGREMNSVRGTCGREMISVRGTCGREMISVRGFTSTSSTHRIQTCGREIIVKNILHHNQLTFTYLNNYEQYQILQYFNRILFNSVNL